MEVMPAISEVEGLKVESASGKRLGVVRRVLFHPSEPVAVGLMVARPAAAGLVDLKPRYIPISPELIASIESEGRVVWPSEKLPNVAASESEAGCAWDETVIWRNMPVRVKDDATLGVVEDVVFSRKTARVLKVVLSEGTVADMAVGRTTVPGELVVGFDGEAVVLETAYLDIPPSGGVAAVSGKGAAYAKIGAEKVADGIVTVGVLGLGAVEKSFRKGMGRKAMKAMRDARRRVDKALDAGDET
jgi:uncharacterized protein YrrD